LRNLLATLGLVIALAAAAGCGSNENSSIKVSSGSSPGTRATQAPAAPASFKVGDQINVGNTMLLAVTQIQAPVNSGNQFLSPKSGQFMKVMVSLQNVSSKPEDVSSAISFEMRDDSGQSYTETLLPDAPKPPDGWIAPNNKLTGGLTYDVPKGKNYKLYYKNKVFNSGQVIIDLRQH
jgi:hypothetical protein